MTFNQDIHRTHIFLLIQAKISDFFQQLSFECKEAHGKYFFFPIFTSTTTLNFVIFYRTTGRTTLIYSLHWVYFEEVDEFSADYASNFPAQINIICVIKYL